MMKNTVSSPLFSVIVPAYNSAAYLEKCVQSVLKQSCGDFELILVDDGSADQTGSICEAFAGADSRVRMFSKENGGHTSARNEGLRHAAGEYVLFLDSDDWISPDVLDICKAEIHKNAPDVLIYRLYNTGTKRFLEQPVPCGTYDLRAPGNPIMPSLLMDRQGKAAFAKGLSGKVFRREVVFHNQMQVPAQLRIAEDGAVFVASMLDASRVSVIPDATYYMDVREGSVSRSSDAKAFERLPFLFAYYRERMEQQDDDFFCQFQRYIVAQLYTATLMVIRSGGGKAELNAGLAAARQEPMVSDALRQAEFGIKGYKLIVKKWILRCRLWKLAAWLDR